MNFLEMSQSELEQRGAELTAREIGQQPELWKNVASIISHDGDLRPFIDPLMENPELQVVLTGAGTSGCIGECLTPVLTRRFGMRIHAVATTDLVSGPENWLARSSPVLLVSFARSGNSPESLAALELAERAVTQCHHLIITCNREGQLFRQGRERRNSHAIALPDASNDRGFAMTSSFSSMLLSGAMAFQLLPSDTTATLALSTRQALIDFRKLTHLTRSGFERVIYLGSGVFRGLAREAALKMLELTDGRIVAQSDTPLGFRHGPKTIVNSRTLVIMFVSNDRYARAYDLDLFEELCRDNIAAQVLALGAADTEIRSGQIVHLPVPPATPDLDLCFPYVVFAQSLALQQSLALGLRPDVPNERGVVNRVVQGVSIYPWNAAE